MPMIQSEYLHGKNPHSYFAKLLESKPGSFKHNTSRLLILRFKHTLKWATTVDIKNTHPFNRG